MYIPPSAGIANFRGPVHGDGDNGLVKGLTLSVLAKEQGLASGCRSAPQGAGDGSGSGSGGGGSNRASSHSQQHRCLNRNQCRVSTIAQLVSLCASMPYLKSYDEFMESCTENLFQFTPGKDRHDISNCPFFKKKKGGGLCIFNHMTAYLWFHCAHLAAAVLPGRGTAARARAVASV